MEFLNKVVIVTGGTSGIGKCTAGEFLKEGADVIAFTVDREEVCQSALSEFGTEHFSVVRCDVSNEENVKNAVESVIAKYGRIDVAFNNAGVGPDGVRMPYQTLTELTEKNWDLTVDIDMKGVWLCMKYELLQMQKQGFGAIVNTASIGGYRMAPAFGAYGAAKAGVIALTEAAAIENARFGIRVNCVCPCPTANTQLIANTIASDPGTEAALTQHVIPTGRLNEPIDIANAVLFLAGEKARQTTGMKMFIDGGMHAA